MPNGVTNLVKKERLFPIFVFICVYSSIFYRNRSTYFALQKQKNTELKTNKRIPFYLKPDISNAAFRMRVLNESFIGLLVYSTNKI